MALPTTSSRRAGPAWSPSVTMTAAAPAPAAQPPAEARGSPRQASGEEVGGDVPLPDRLLEDGPSVVRPGLGAHRLSPRNETTMAAAMARAAAPAAFHIDGRSRVVTTGSGGRP